MENINKGQIDFTDGKNLTKKLIIFTLPVILGAALSLFFTTADLLTVSKFGEGTTSMSAIGANAAIINLLVSFFLGFGTGANVVVANLKGENDKENAKRAVGSAILIAIFSGLIMTILGLFLAKPVIKATGISDELLEKATLYLKIYLIGSPFMLVFQFGSSILRAIGDSKRPLYALGFSGIFNVGVNLLFVIAFKMDVLGVALSTVISNVIAAICVLYFLRNNKSDFICFSFKDLKIYKKEALEILKIGIASALQSTVFCVTNIIIQSSINSFGDNAIAGMTIANNIENYQYICLNSLGVGALAAFSQNNGSQNKENLKKLFKIGMTLEVSLGLFLGLLFLLLKRPLINIFVSPSEDGYKEVYDVASTKLNVICLTYFLCGVMEMFCSYYRGLKYASIPFFAAFVGSGIFRVVFIYTLFKLPFFHNLYWLSSLWPISWIMINIFYLCILKNLSKKRFDTYIQSKEIE